MMYSRFIPNPKLQSWVDCYWSVKGTNTSIQKIIPDGFSELVFHLGDRYSFIDGSTAALQSTSIVAGQINKPIYLRPEGNSDVFGIKFKPTGIWQLTGLPMHCFSNATVALEDAKTSLSTLIQEKLILSNDMGARILSVDEILLVWFHASQKSKLSVDKLVETIQQSHGTISMRELTTSFKISSRKMERMFLEQVGVSAKQYSRLVRFNHVFGLMQQPQLTRADVCFLAGYFDQSHFNNEFREFAGENPETYFEQNHAFANFFMNR